MRPAFYDDNYFSLLPGESRVIRISFGDTGVDPADVQLVVDGWNIKAQIYRPGDGS